MGVLELTEILKTKGIKLELDNGSLKVKAPKGALDKALADTLKAQKQNLIEWLNNNASEHSPASLTKRPDESQITLSYGQNRMWFLDHIDDSSDLYNVPFALRLKGDLKIDILESTFQAIAMRHHSLRTVYVRQQDKVNASLRESLDGLFEHIDLSDKSEQERESSAQQIAIQERSVGFDLEKDLMIRVKLVTLCAGEYLLFVTLHHIATDGWSMGVLLKELGELYNLSLVDEQATLPELDIQYADYAHWQHAQLQGEQKEELVNYWTKQLHDIPPQHNLPLDRPRPKAQTFNGNTYVFEIDGTTAERLRALSSNSGTTLFMTMLSFYAAILYRYSGDQDLVIGTPVAGRSEPELENIIGLFINTLALRVDLSGTPNFTELLKRVRKTALDAYEHQALPFEMLVDELNPERAAAYSPIFQVFFSLSARSEGGIELAGLEVDSLMQSNNNSKFDLCLDIRDSADSLHALWEYNTDLFDLETIERMADHMNTLIHRVLEQSELNLDAVPLLSDDETRLQVVQWNQSARDYPLDTAIHNLFEAQAQRTPNAIAVMHKDTELTYEALSRLSDDLAHTLLAQGVKPGQCVGVCLAPCTELIVSILAIFKVGAVYVPLDPGYPSQRLSLICSKADLQVLLTSKNISITLDEYSGPVVYVESLVQSTLETQSLTLPEVDAEQAAYLLFTSGSTGQPKGVQVSHRSLVNFSFSLIEESNLQSCDRMMQLASISFDVFFEEVIPPLFIGATAVLKEETPLISALDLQQVMDRYKVTCVNLNTAHWQQWVNELYERGMTPPDSLRLVIVGGEIINPERLKQWKAYNLPLIHLYGQTEACCDSMIYHYRPEDPLVEVLPIGGPIANTQVYVLDEHMHIQPIGVVGEIYIGGAGLAMGYYNAPELTRSKFVPSPFIDGQLLCKTGDLGKARPDGNVEYVGRADQQVKLRGFRIELEEIEACLMKLPEVKDNVVIVREDEPNNKYLAAYVVLQNDEYEHSELTSRLRDVLGKQLPQYMVPSAFTYLNTIPLTANAKVDKRTLPKPTIENLKNSTYVAPETELESLLVSLYEQTLKTAPIGVSDNYFSIGGDSLRVVELSLKARKHDIFFEVKDVFQHQTIRELADFLSNNQETEANIDSLFEEMGQAEDYLNPLPDSVEDAYPATQLQCFMIEQHQKAGEKQGIYHPLNLYGIDEPNFDPDLFESALNRLIHKNPTYRTAFIPSQKWGYLQCVKKHLNVSLPREDLSDLSETQRHDYFEKVFARELETGFKFEQLDDEMIRFGLYRISDSNWYFLMSSHHVIDDGWGVVAMMNELIRSYRALKLSQSLPEYEVSQVCREFSALDRISARSESSRAFWQEKLAGFNPLRLKRKGDVSGKIVQGHLVDGQRVPLEKLKLCAQSQQVTLRAVFLYAYAHAIQTCMGDQGVAVDVVTNGRSSALSDPLCGVGLFWHLCPVVLNTQVTSSTAQLKSMHDYLLALDLHGAYPIGALEDVAGCTEISVAAFNFVHFHNKEDRQTDDGFNMQVLHAKDRFHHPIKAFVSLSQDELSVQAYFEYDESYFSAADVADIEEQMLVTIDQLVKGF